jgi:release factor glutamine methyltransferase
MTVIEALQWANNKLKKANVDSPMLDAEILLANLLKQKKSWLFAHFADKLKTHHEEQFKQVIQRRAGREPVAYLTGVKEFYGRSFYVSPATLIPRPATETLIETGLKILENTDPERTLICDIGTGSGAIGLTLAKETSIPTIISDISKEALEIADKNAKNLETEQVDVQHGNLAEPLIRMFKTIRGQTDVQTSWMYPFSHLLISANLPYLPTSMMEHTQPEVRDHEPRLALVAGDDGLDAYWELFRQLRTHRTILPKHLYVLIELDPEQRKGAEGLILQTFPDADIQCHKDLQGLDRIIEAKI